jgi:type VI secretion system protein VasD
MLDIHRGNLRSTSPSRSLGGLARARSLSGLCLMLCLALAGCGTKPTLIQGQLSATADVNPDSNGRASPIVVRVYDLKAVAAFETADFFSLWDKDQATLGADVTGRDEYLMRPGEERKLERAPQNGAAFLGVVAAFRDIEHARWRATVAVPPNTTTELTIKLDARGINIAAPNR